MWKYGIAFLHAWSGGNTLPGLNESVHRDCYIIRWEFIAKTGVATSWCWQCWKWKIFSHDELEDIQTNSLSIDAIDWMMFVPAHCCDQDKWTDFVTCRNLGSQCLPPISISICILKISEIRFVGKLSVSHPISPSCSGSRWKNMRIQLCCNGSVFGTGINMNANAIWSSDFELVCIWCHTILCCHCADGAQETIHDTRWDIQGSFVIHRKHFYRTLNTYLFCSNKFFFLSFLRWSFYQGSTDFYICLFYRQSDRKIIGKCWISAPIIGQCW